MACLVARDKRRILPRDAQALGNKYDTGSKRRNRLSVYCRHGGLDPWIILDCVIWQFCYMPLERSPKL